jgi:glutamyl-tRNA synthetase
VPLGCPVFDVPKLDWLNGRYIRERLDTSEFLTRVQAWGFSPAKLARIAALAQPRIERFSDAGLMLAFFFAGRLNVTADSLRGGKLDDLEMRQAYQIAQWEFDGLRDWNLVGIEGSLKRVAAILGKKFRDIVRPFYVAVTGSPTSVPLFDAMELLGRDMVRERLRHALELLGTPSSKEQNEWKKLAPAVEVAQ